MSKKRNVWTWIALKFLCGDCDQRKIWKNTIEMKVSCIFEWQVHDLWILEILWPIECEFCRRWLEKQLYNLVQMRLNNCVITYETVHLMHANDTNFKKKEKLEEKKFWWFFNCYKSWTLYDLNVVLLPIPYWIFMWFSRNVCYVLYPPISQIQVNQLWIQTKWTFLILGCNEIKMMLLTK